MFCNKCGFHNKDGFKYCVSCGNKLDKIMECKRLSLIFGIICIVSSIFSYVMCFVFGILGIAYGIKSKKVIGEYGVGFVLSIVGIIIRIVFTIFLIFLLLIIGFSEIEHDINNNVDVVNGVKTEKF